MSGITDSSKAAQAGVPLTFQAAPLPSPRAAILTPADLHQVDCPRPKKFIDYTDDGKLFEGHLSLQSRSLKGIIQCLVSQQEEQRVIIHDLQDQLSIVRAKAAKAARGGAARGGGAGPMEVDVLYKRLARVENFVQLWGARPEEVARLIESYGDPVVTPEAYTAYLLELAPFRLTRREAKSMLSSSRLSASPTKVRPQIMETADDGGNARQARQAAAEILERVQALEQQVKSISSAAGGSEPPPQFSEEVIDVQAREDIEQLSDYLTRRLKDMEVRTNAVPSPVSRHGGAPSIAGGRRPQLPADDADDEEEGYVNTRNQSQRTTAVNPKEARRETSRHDRRNVTVEEETATENVVVEEGDRSDAPTERRKRTSAKSTSSKHASRSVSSSRRSGGESATVAGRDGGESVFRPHTRQRGIAAADRSAGHSSKESTKSNSRPDRSAAPAAEEETRQADHGTSNPRPSRNAPRTVADDANFVDSVARDDAAMSLERVDELERTVERRLGELHNAIHRMERQGGIGQMKGTPAVGITSPALQQSAERRPQVVEEGGEGVGSGGRSSVKGLRGSRNTTTPRDRSAQRDRPSARSRETHSLSGGGRSGSIGGPVLPLGGAGNDGRVNFVVGEEVNLLAERMSEIEEDTGRRLQSLEERLRIIGRAAMTPGAAHGALLSVDRKAREDASLSLMRIQHLERELALLRRQLCVSSPVNLGLRGPDGKSAPPLTVATSFGAGDDDAATTIDLRDTYTSKVDALEKDVQERMADVNRAIALLKEVDDCTGRPFSMEALLRVSNSIGMGSLVGTSSSQRSPQKHPEQRDDCMVLHSSDADLDGGSRAAGTLPDSTLPNSLGSFADTLVLDSHTLGVPSTCATTLATPTKSLRYVHRLRSPAGPTFGCNLVVREAITSAVTPPASALVSSSNRVDGAPAASVLGPLGETVSGSLTSNSVSHAVATPPATARVSLSVQPKETVRPTKPTVQRGRPARDVLGHTTPCVVADCAWCGSDANRAQTI